MQSLKKLFHKIFLIKLTQTSFIGSYRVNSTDNMRTNIPPKILFAIPLLT